MPIPSFLINSTKNVALISCVILFPFMVIDLIQGNYLLATGILGLVILYLATAYRCHKGVYSLNMSLLGIAPVITTLSIYSLYTLGISASFWSFAALFVLYFVLPLKLAAWVNGLFILAIIPVANMVMELKEFTRFILVLTGSSLFVFMCIREIYNQNKLLINLSHTDTLTGLKNRTLLNDTVVHAININERYKTPVSLLLIDVDNFKTVNDKFGHNTGDQTLIDIASLMRENFRDADEIFRLGGEEFLVLLHDSDSERSQIIAERFRSSVESAILIANHVVTVSIGVCERTSEPTPQAWISACDKQLYRAKKLGRNRIECA